MNYTQTSPIEVKIRTIPKNIIVEHFLKYTQNEFRLQDYLVYLNKSSTGICLGMVLIVYSVGDFYVNFI